MASDDLDRLVSELEIPPADSGGTTSSLDRWLSLLVQRRGSDLFLVAGSPPALRISGIVTPLGEGTLDGDDVEAAVMPTLHARALQSYKTNGSADISLRRSGLG